MSIVKLNNRGVRSATTFGSISALGEMRFISKQTASSSSTISFTSGIDSTYKEYLFTFNNIHPSGNDIAFQVQFNAAGGSGFNETITSTAFDAYHAESGSANGLRYITGSDQAQGTSYQNLVNCTNGNDESAAGFLYLFNPSSTTFVKHFIARSCSTQQSYANEVNVAGYINTTSAIDEVSFKMASGDIDAGDICLYGIA
jgi:hypothetical protein